MTRILYLPTGDCIKFVKARNMDDKVSFTEIYENSLVARCGKTPMEFIQYIIAECNEVSFKNRNNIPIHGKVFIEEFEILQ